MYYSLPIIQKVNNVLIALYARQQHTQKNHFPAVIALPSQDKEIISAIDRLHLSFNIF